jgi:gas vesicle protein
MKSRKVLLGVLAGVAVGALVGVLFAPEKGSKIRKKILNKGEGYTDELKEKYEELVAAITKKYEAIEHNAENLIAKGKAKINEAIT